MSSKDRLRSLGIENVHMVGQEIEQRSCRPLGVERLGPLVERKIRRDQDRGPLIAL